MRRTIRTPSGWNGWPGSSARRAIADALPEGDGEALTQAANGVVGLETALGLALELVHRGVIGPARMVEMMSLNPARLLRLEARHAGSKARARISRLSIRISNGQLTRQSFFQRAVTLRLPAGGLKGRAIVTIVAGEIVYDGRIRRSAGDDAKREAILALADGRIFRGRAFGAIGETVGEVVFNTAMTGYQEVLTDPSYKGQMVCMTYPEIGNVGINAEDAESARVYVEGFIVKEYCARPSNWRSEMSLGEYLEACRCGRASRGSIRARWCGTSARMARRRR